MRAQCAAMLLLLAGCEYAPAETHTYRDWEQRGASSALSEVEPQLPAWEETPLALGKADEYDDYRAAHPELYSVTAPPNQTVRPFSEYEPTQAVLIRPGPDVGKFHAAVIRGLVGHVEQIWVLHATGQSTKMRDILVDVGVPEELLHFFDMTKTDANWIRDFGPLTVLTQAGEVGFMDFRYYHQRAQDDAVPTRLADQLGIRVFRPSLSLEGGNLMADTKGSCYLTDKLYTQNAGHTAEEVDRWMHEYLGCEHLIIVKRPDHLSTGHIDMFAKLVGPQTILVGDYAEPTSDSNGAILDSIAEQLAGVAGESGTPLNVLRIPMPPYTNEVWYTYTNSLLVNDVLLMPTFKDYAEAAEGESSLEEQALAVYQQALPDCEIVEIPSDALIPAGGAVHCMTMSLPTGSLVPFQPKPAALCDLNEVSKCDDAGLVCLGWPEEGECAGAALRYCGADGYPREVSCPGCCGLETGGIYHNCLAAATCETAPEECALGESGCSNQATHRWRCEADAQGGLQRRYQRCVDGPCMEGQCTADVAQACALAGSGCVGKWALECGQAEGADAQGDTWLELCGEEGQTCAVGEAGPACSPVAAGNEACNWLGSRRCSVDGRSVEVCTEDSPGETQRWGLAATCPDGEQCEDGVCVLVPEEPDVIEGGESDGVEEMESSACGCAASHQPTANALLPLLLSGLLWLLARSRRSQVA